MPNLLVTSLHSENVTQTKLANLTLAQDVEIRIVPTSSSASKFATRLEKALLQELIVIGGDKSDDDPLGDDLLKGLLLVSDDTSPADAKAEQAANEFRDISASEGFVLPIIPVEARSKFTELVPAAAHKYNAAMWNKSPREVLPAILQRTGLAYNRPAVSISYRQTDTAALAIQLFDKLSHAGFDVFLDKFRIPPGGNFQAVLTQELGEKSMMLVLESENLSESEWVKYEISVAKACGLGVLGLRLPDCPTERSIDLHMSLKEDDMEKKNGLIKEKELPRIIGDITNQIVRINVLRRQTLKASLEIAAQDFGCKVDPGPGGSFILEKDSRQRKIWLTSQPPNAPDFYKAHSKAEKMPASILGLTRLWRLERANLGNWLSDLSKLSLIDTDDLIRHVDDFSRGKL